MLIQVPDVHHHSARRLGRITALVLHDTGGLSAQSAIRWFQAPESQVSAHYIIDRDGTAYRCVPDARKAWHAGASSLWGVPDVNEYSLGVELVDQSLDPYPFLQLMALAELCATLCREYRIPLHRIVGHEHVALPLGRKVDPGSDLDWYALLLAIAHRLPEGGP